jgi:hypothetical protein
LVLSLGTNANLLFARRVPTKTENGLIVFEGVLAVSLVMPWSATLVRNGGGLFEAAQLTASPVEKRALGCNEQAGDGAALVPRWFWLLTAARTQPLNMRGRGIPHLASDEDAPGPGQIHLAGAFY